MADLWRAGIILWFGLGALLLALHVFGSFAYDMRETILRMRLHGRRTSQKQIRKPSVTVLIPTHNDSPSIIGCLDALRANRYKKMNIIVVDGRSADDTADIVRQYIDRSRLKSVRLIAKRTPLTTMKQMTRDAREHITGEYVLWLTPRSLISPDAIEAAVTGLEVHPEAGLLVPQRRIASASAMAGIFQQYMFLLSRRTDKMRSVLGLAPRPVEGDFLFFRRSALADLSGRCPALPGLTPLSLDAPPPLRPVYVHDASVTLPPVRSFGQLLSAQRTLQRAAMDAFFHASRPGRLAVWFTRLVLQAVSAVFTLLTPFIVGYFIYLSIGLRQPKLLLAVWLALAVLLASAALTDERIPLRRKLASIAGMPVSFGFFFAFSFLPVLSLLSGALPSRRRPLRVRPA
jgi:hypothetical protein